MLTIVLGKGEERRIRGGHPWVFSNEIKEVAGAKQPGAAAEFFTSGGDFLGTGYYNPHSLIAGRLLARERVDIDSQAFFHGRLATALAFRRTVYPELTSFRLVFGEGDLLPGLVVDKYGDYLALQLLTMGMEQRRELIVAALSDLLRPKGVIARNDVAVRGLEGLPEKSEILAGQVPDSVEIEEHGLRFLVNLGSGQKTGHFLDQKENHRLLQPLVAGKTLLDCFSYSGSWGIHGAAYGARSVTCLDISPLACGLARRNAALNGFAEQIAVEECDVFDRLRSLKSGGQRFDVIVLDPPAFVKSKKNLKEAEKGYLTINRRAMELLAPGGVLISCSCSFHMGRELFRETLGRAAQQAGRLVRLLGNHSQSPDHPILLQVPETEYLKCVVLQAVD
jgi:23S rRNA (cytosine1962-C5)-methyltransferase